MLSLERFPHSRGPLVQRGEKWIKDRRAWMRWGIPQWKDPDYLPPRSHVTWRVRFILRPRDWPWNRNRRPKGRAKHG